MTNSIIARSSVLVSMLPMLGLSMFIAGCQNNVEIKVEQIRGLQSTKLAPNSRLGRRMQTAILQLSTLAQACDLADQKLDILIGSLKKAEQESPASEPTKKKELAQLVKDTQAAEREVKETATTAKTLLESAGRIMAGKTDKSITDLKSTIHAQLFSINAFLSERNITLRAYVEAGHEIARIRAFLDNNQELKAEINELDLLAQQLDDAINASASDQMAIAGFGGFMATDVYAITPSDPAYREILNSAKLSRRPITSTKVNVSGDSSIMLVMEHPGQFRVYQISNDPTQLAKNIALIVSKAAEGAAKFSGVGLP